MAAPTGSAMSMPRRLGLLGMSPPPVAAASWTS
eukprot:CAMPEP_0119500944 /NCGR_PEP_ID=MMETSP1344-20130328/22927_1 /TAXON_ID=236787 /ORGANISM="Florenciella parvula, Strain CCMP2471" /LENGTH=32 /DNA_ID= /DNA_START= /DNA_END= /DNA_ORIENTATION=